jgi:hypothetical protein
MSRNTSKIRYAVFLVVVGSFIQIFESNSEQLQKLHKEKKIGPKSSHVLSHIEGRPLLDCTPKVDLCDLHAVSVYPPSSINFECLIQYL